MASITENRQFGQTHPLYQLKKIGELYPRQTDITGLLNLLNCNNSEIFSTIQSDLEKHLPWLVTHMNNAGGRTARFGRVLGLDPKPTKHLTAAATWHDIGKYPISPNILNKPSPLDFAEKRVVRQHTTIGYLMLKAIALNAEPQENEKYQTMIDVATFHHQWWNGDPQGYPFTIYQGKYLPLGPRIYSVIDIFGALTEQRPYNHPVTPDQALQQIGQLLGNRLDPEIGRVFLDHAQEII